MKYFDDKKIHLWLLSVILTLLLLCSILWILTKSSGIEDNTQVVILKERGYLQRCLIENALKSSHQGKLPPNIAKVDSLGEKEIYRSGFLDKQFIPALAGLGIQSIITLSSVSEDTRQAIEKAGLVHKEFNFISTEMTKGGLKTVIEEILALPDPILVHCRYGADRTGLVIASLKATLGEKDSGKLFAEMKTYCHLNWPRYKYFHQLLDEFITNNQSNKNY